MEIYHPDALRLSELRILKSYINDYNSFTKDISDKVHAWGYPKWSRVTELRQRGKADLIAAQLEIHIPPSV